MKHEKTALLNTLEAYFRAGIKSSYHQKIGVEVEHFILNEQTGEALPYAGPGGVMEILKALMALYPGAKATGGDHLLGFEVPEFNITLEPAAQLEISIAYMESVTEIEYIYLTFREKLDAVCRAFHACVRTCGTQPVSRVDDLQLIPKERYALMDRYFTEAGTDGREMMRGTCSTQVSIDYFSEEDFRRKIQAAYYFTPLLKLLSDNSPVFQGVRTQGYLKRNDIWDRTDNRRCGVVPGIFAEDYSFADYAAFLAAMPVIFTEKDGLMNYTGLQSTADVYAGQAPDREETMHIISMAFPDVRLKQYLEIRAADAMPARYIPAYCALIKGLLYSEEVLDRVQGSIREHQMTEDTVRETQRQLMARGWDGEIYGRKAADFAAKAIGLAGQNLDDRERKVLERLFEITGKGIAAINKVECE